MKSLFPIILFLCFTTAISAQSTQTKYFKDEWLGKEVSPSKAKFVQMITQNEDGSVTKEVRDLRTDKIISRESTKGEEPVGVWLTMANDMPVNLDYNFELVYTDSACSKNALPETITDVFKDNAAEGYKAPQLSTGDASLVHFFMYKIRMPARAREENIQGRVFLYFTISKTGAVENIQIQKGVHVVLDKEAVRVIRLLKFSNPPLLNGVPVSFCFNMPINFKIQ